MVDDKIEDVTNLNAVLVSLYLSPLHVDCSTELSDSSYLLFDWISNSVCLEVYVVIDIKFVEG